ncbi:hypothetical protein HDV63DRAFT_40480 [Trichoderma sp. SZMC 28014]
MSQYQMEDALLCNNQACRKELTDRAFVTTCSHIFCTDCIQKFGLIGRGNQRCTSCPACDVQLPKEEDVALINVNPTEEFKTCVLSGLSPNTIMECAGRAISFWSYQVTHETHYQRHRYKSLWEKHSELWAQHDQVKREYSADMNRLGDKLKSMTELQDALQQKNNELAAAYQDKSRKLFQTQELYNKVKKRAELSQIEQAAFNAVDTSTRSVPQPSTSNQASNSFRPHSLNGENERSFPLNRGIPRFEAADFITGLNVSNMPRYESESRWPRKRPQVSDAGSSNISAKRKRPTLRRDFSPQCL